MVGLQSRINPSRLEQFRHYVRGMPPKELVAIGEIVATEMARQRALPPIPQCDGAPPPLATLSTDPSHRSLRISLDWITG